MVFYFKDFYFVKNIISISTITAFFKKVYINIKLPFRIIIRKCCGVKK